MSSEAAITKSNALLSIATNPSSTPQQRRSFFEHLLTLPAYPSYKAKAHFGTLVSKYFAECEDLQDRAVDAILDLCEDDDEKTRIVGIKGLGSTGKMDPRWVGGNVGVLLQLLECPPTELKHVRESIFTLLTISPSDVFSVMIDDFRGSESETGASRRNILAFLVDQAAESRKTILESGNYPGAERVFREGFGGVIGGLPWDDSVRVLGMMARLSTISGKKATREMAGDFLRTLRKSLREGAGDEKMEGLMGVFEGFVERKPPVDPRAVLLFLSAHGEGVVRLAMERGDKASREAILHRLDGWVGESVKIWKGSGRDAEFEEGKVGPDFCDAMLRGLRDQRDLIGKTKDANMTVRLLEAILDATYRIIAIKDRRTDIISKSQKDTFYKITTQVKGLFVDPSNEDAKSNIQKICKVLSDPLSKLIEITPSWRVVATSKPVAVAPPTGPRQPVKPPPVGPRAEKRVIPPSGPSAQRRPSQPIAGPSGSSNQGGNRMASNGSGPPRSRSPTKVEQLKVDDRPATPPTPVESPTKVIPPISHAQRSTATPAIRASPIPPTTRPSPAVPNPKAANELLARQAPTSSNIKPNVQPIAPRGPSQRASANAGKELMPSSTTEPVQAKSAAAEDESETKLVTGAKRDVPPHLRAAPAAPRPANITSSTSSVESAKSMPHIRAAKSATVSSGPEAISDIELRRDIPPQPQSVPTAPAELKIKSTSSLTATPLVPPISAEPPRIAPLSKVASTKIAPVETTPPSPKPVPTPPRDLASRLGPQVASTPIGSSRSSIPETSQTDGSSGAKPTLPSRIATALPLSARIAPAISISGTKRPRDTSPAPRPAVQEIEPARPRLSARMGIVVDERDAKRLREVSAGGTSLADRIQKDNQNGGQLSGISQLATGTSTQGISSIRGRATPNPTLPPKPTSTLSIRAALSQTAPELATLTVPKMLTLLGHARNGAPAPAAPKPLPAVFSIRNQAKPAVPFTTPIVESLTDTLVEEQGVTRKGRGFAEEDQDGDDLMGGIGVIHPTGGGRGSLQDRLGVMNGSATGNGDGFGIGQMNGHHGGMMNQGNFVNRGAFRGAARGWLGRRGRGQ